MWKQIEGYEKYSVSDTGLVKNTRTGKLLKLKNTYDGYCEVRLYAAKDIESSKCIRVHRLVAKTFIPNPNKLDSVDHINGIKTDNRVENLRWLSSRDNLKRFWEEQATEKQKEQLAHRKPIKCLENGVVYESITQAAEELGLKRTSLVMALTRKTNKLRGYHFELVKEKAVC